MGAEREANLHGGPSEKAERLPNVEGAIDKGLHLRICLRVPDVEVDGTAIRTLGVTNDLRWMLSQKTEERRMPSASLCVISLPPLKKGTPMSLQNDLKAGTSH